MNADRIIACVCGVVGAIWAFAGLFIYGFWMNKGPGPGFLPVIIGVVTCILCILLILRRDTEVEPVDKNAIKPIAAMIAFVLAIYIIGFIATILVFMVAWLVHEGAYSYKFSIILASAVTLLIWGVFEYWLQVPFPSGLITI